MRVTDLGVARNKRVLTPLYVSKGVLFLLQQRPGNPSDTQGFEARR
jgi:hypothetical protein